MCVMQRRSPYIIMWRCPTAEQRAARSGPYFITLQDATEGLINMHDHRLLLPSSSPSLFVSLFLCQQRTLIGDWLVLIRLKLVHSCPIVLLWLSATQTAQVKSLQSISNSNLMQVWWMVWRWDKRWLIDTLDIISSGLEDIQSVVWHLVLFLCKWENALLVFITLHWLED